ncbi:hypothetical protein PIB30_047981 [Stylosanthes scabra]|uniref:Uncharacterized protein n=1 Tax=Stylosanthes scabra TaxID=79078 RepID=A0ABU6SHE6_9FABA|nr:hypothetical protein [Stylosanthes scabra]
MEHIDNFESGMELRTQRMIEAAMKIVSRSSPNLQKWITCDALGRKFYAARPDQDHNKKETENAVASDDRSATGELEPNQKAHINTVGNGKCIAGDNNPSSYSSNDKSLDVEEEEVILFRPLTRYNSAPSYSYPSSTLYEKVPPKDKDDQGLTPEDCLHCPAPILMSQNPSQSDPRGFHGDTANKSFRQQEASMKEPSNAHTISAGPPSLSSWVLDRNMGTNGGSEQRLQPIDETASSYLAALSISKTENSVNESLYFPPTSASMPSAPSLPDNAAWFTGIQSTFPAPLLPNNPPTISGHEYWSSASTYVTPGFVSGFQVNSNGFQQSERISSSEWLCRYRENDTHEHFNNHMVQPTHLNVVGNHENSFHHDTYRLNNFNQYGQWGNPIPYHYTYMEPPLQPVLPYTFGAAEHSSTNLFNNVQRPSPYGCSGAVTKQLRNEPQLLLEYLKEKEWRLQRDPTYMGN